MLLALLFVLVRVCLWMRWFSHYLGISTPFDSVLPIARIFLCVIDRLNNI